MVKLPARLHSLGLFGKISLVVVAGVAAVAAFTLGSALRAAEHSYVQTLSAANVQILQDAEAQMAAANDLVTQLLIHIGGSASFRGYLTGGGENPTAFRLIYEMVRELKSIAPGSPYDVATVSADGRLRYVSNDSDLSLPAEELLQGELTESARSAPGRILYRFVPRGITNRSREGGAMVAVKALTYPVSREIYGFAYVVLRQQDLQSFYSKSSTPFNTLALFDTAGNLVSAADELAEAPGELAAALNEMNSENSNLQGVTLWGRPVTLQTRTMPQWGLTLTSVLDQRRALREMSGRADIILVCVLVCAAVLAALFLFIRQLTRPINRLAEKMQNVASGDLTAQHIEVRGSYEARQLADAFNYMLDDVNRYVGRLVTLEQEKREMEITALQTQIKPHFIYNTLTSIKWLIWQRETERAAQCIDAFSLLLRGTIGNQKELHTMAEEMESLKHYIFLQQIRYGDRIRVDTFLGPAASALFMPKLLLQPIVENAFFHAFTDRAQGSVSVYADLRGEDLVCEVIDDGVGMSGEQAEAILKGGGSHSGDSGIGLANVDARVKLLFGDKYGVRIFSAPGGGTTVRVTLAALIDEDGLKKSTKI